MILAPTLREGDVVLRALREDDVPACHEQCVDPLSVRWTTVPVPFTHAMAREFCLEIAPGAWADGSQWIFAVEAGGRYAGNIALRPERPGRAEVAYGSHPSARGTGVMESALRLLLAWGFTAQGLRTVLWQADVGNWASRKLAWRLGFRVEGTLRAYLDHRGEPVDAWVGTLLRDDAREPVTAWRTAPVLDGDGVRLRPLREADVPRVVEACGDERTGRWLGRMPAPYTEADARAWIEHTTLGAAEGRVVTWVVADPASDLLLGAMNVFDLDPATTPGVKGEVGYWAHPDARGRGVMTAATRRTVRWCFEELGLRKVGAAAALDNAASRHVIEAAGLRLYGVERLGTQVRAGLADVARYDLLAEEWAASADSAPASGPVSGA